MLPDDYPDDFTHNGLLPQWFRGVPWRFQERVRSVNPGMLVVRNPITQVFVVALKLNPNDPQQVYPFFGTSRMVGWMPLLELDRGEPVEAIHRLAEGMERSREFMAKHYGETKEEIAAAVKGDAEALERARQDAMVASTSFARVYGSQVMAGTRFSEVNSPKLKEDFFADAQKDFLVASAENRRQLQEKVEKAVPKP